MSPPPALYSTACSITPRLFLSTGAATDSSQTPSSRQAKSNRTTPLKISKTKPKAVTRCQLFWSLLCIGNRVNGGLASRKHYAPPVQVRIRHIAPRKSRKKGNDELVKVEILCRNPAGPEGPPGKGGNRPEVSIGESSEMAASSVCSEHKSRVIEPRNIQIAGAFVFMSTGAAPERQMPSAMVRPCERVPWELGRSSCRLFY